MTPPVPSHRQTAALALGALALATTLWAAGSVAVVPPTDPTAVEAFAAAELVRYLELATGCHTRLADAATSQASGLRFWVGMAEPARLQAARFPMAALAQRLEALTADGVCIVGDGRDVILVGKPPRGALNAVYLFLEEQLGIHWPEPGEEFVPRAPMPRLDDLAIVSNPAFPYRGVAIHGRCGDEFFAKLLDWLAKNRLNGFQLFCGHYNQLRPWALPEIARRGLFPNIGGHSRGYFFPASRHFHDHPEYFALVGGQRQEHTQLCYSNLDSVPAYAASVVQYVRERPEIGMVGLWPEDGYGFCECAPCKSKSPTDVILNYVNRLAAAISQELPDLKCEFLSYIHYTTPPQTVKPLPNVVPTYCEYWSRNQFHPITDERSANAKCRRELDAWIAASSEVTLFSYYGDDCIKRYLYNPVMDVISTDCRNYRKAGLKGQFLLLTNPESWWSNAPHLYAYSKAAWDPQTDMTRVARDYYDALYGPAADAMQAHARACRALFDLKTAQGPTGEDVLFGFHFPVYDESKDTETRRQIAAAVDAIKTALEAARATKPRPSVMARIATLESDAGYVHGVLMSAYEARRAASSDTPEQRERVIEWVEQALAQNVMATDDAGGYRSANNCLCRIATGATGLAADAIQVPGGFGYGAFATVGARCTRTGVPMTLTELPARLQRAVLVRTYGSGAGAFRGLALNLPRGTVVSVAVLPDLATPSEWLSTAGFAVSGETVKVATPDGTLSMPLYRRDITKDGKLEFGVRLTAGDQARNLPPFVAFISPPREFCAIPPTPIGTSHIGLMKSGQWLQLRFPVPAAKPAEFVCRLGNVVAYHGKGKSYQLVVRADSAAGPLVYEGPVITKDDDWNQANAAPIALGGVLNATHLRQGYIDLYVTGTVEGDGWTIYRHDPVGRRIVAVEYPSPTGVAADRK